MTFGVNINTEEGKKEESFCNMNFWTSDEPHHLPFYPPTITITHGPILDGKEQSFTYLILVYLYQE